MTDTTNILFDCPVPPWVAGLAAVLVLGAVLVFVRRDAAQVRPLVRRLLLVLAVVAAAMLAGLMLNPKIIRTWLDPHKPLCAVLVDASRSMAQEDTYGGEAAAWIARRQPGEPKAATERVALSREEIVRLLLRSDEGWLVDLAEEFELVGWQFAAEAEALPLGPEAEPFAVNPEGYATALGEALDQVRRPAGDVPPRAVVLLGDGAWNAGRDPTEVARTLGGMDVPVFALGIGDPDPPRDVRVGSLRGPESVHLGDEIRLTAEVSATGMGAARLPVHLVSGGEVVARKQAVAPAGGQLVPVNFSFVPEVPGRRTFAATVPVQEDEADEGNNTARWQVAVTERTIRVLLVEGKPRWEFRFLRNVVERDPSVKLTTYLLRDDIREGGRFQPTAGPQTIETLPEDEKELLDYDVVVLGDIPRAGLPESFLDLLAGKIREHGGALVVIAGRRGTYRNLVDTAAEEILPVTLDGSSAGRDGAPFRAELTQEGMEHLMTRFAPDEEANEAVWAALPKLRWSADVAGLARGATALLVHPYKLAGTSKLPLLAVQRVGTGKVMFLGIEGTWRWRREVGDKYHYRFWAQALRWLVREQFAEGDPRARLSLDRTTCDVGETVEVEAYCLGPGGFPLEDASVWAQVQREDAPARRLAMEAAAGSWGIYRARFRPSEPGTVTFRPIVSVYGNEPLDSEVTLTAKRPDLESRSLAQDAGTLSAVAQASGGQYVTIEESGRLSSLLAAEVERRVLKAEVSPCRHWAYYTALALLLGAAWLIRKRSGLA